PLLMSGGAIPQRWRTHILGTVEAVSHVVQVEEQILGTGLGVYVQAFVSCFYHLIQSFPGGEMNDVQLGSGELGEFDRPMGSFAFEYRFPDDAVKDRIGLAPVEGLGDEDVDGDAVL